MYQLFLIGKYLRLRLVPLFAVLAVTLCSAMVIIVISVMGGFLHLMRQSAQQLSGDVAVTSDLSGFSHYDVLLDRLRDLPEVESAAAIIQTYGLINLEGRTLTVQVVGANAHNLDKITNFRDSLYWTQDRVAEDLDQHMIPEDEVLTEEQKDLFDRYRQRWLDRDMIAEAMDFRAPPQEPGGEPRPGIVPGIEVNPANFRNEQGDYTFYTGMDQEAVLTVVPLTEQGAFKDQPRSQKFVVVNEFKSGLYDLDANRVYVPFQTLQRMLLMEPRTAPILDPETGEQTGTEQVPGRATDILLKASPGVDADELAVVVWPVVSAFRDEHFGVSRLNVLTWEQRHQTLLNAVENEKGLLVILFAIISVVAIVMIAVIFYMIVLAKTRDIGILRAVGSSSLGVAGIFLGYGLVIGLLGAGLGFALGAGVVWNLNPIQDTLHYLFGFQMWNPQIYYFDKIPNRIDPTEVTVILITAVAASVLGSLVPALLAARVDPVESLRYE